MSQWLDRLSEFFVARSDALAEVLDAGACREGWIQAELFRWFRPRFHRCFRVNSKEAIPQMTVDLWCTADSPMVAEIKLLGSTYESKCITGGTIRPFVNRESSLVGPTDRDLIGGDWGLIPDYFRLKDADLPDAYERILVLVADMRERNEKLITQALRTIEFQGLRKQIEIKAGFVRMWSLEMG